MIDFFFTYGKNGPIFFLAYGEKETTHYFFACGENNCGILKNDNRQAAHDSGTKSAEWNSRKKSESKRPPHAPSITLVCLVSIGGEKSLKKEPAHLSVEQVVEVTPVARRRSVKPVAPVAYQVILEPGIGQFREFEPRRVQTRINSLELFLVDKLTCGKRESVS